jgi:hypothetical protein
MDIWNETRRNDVALHRANGATPIQPAPSKVAAHLSMLELAGIEVADPASDLVEIEGLELHLSTGFWRSADGKRGYDARSFIAEFRRRRGSSSLLPKLSL